MSNTQTKSGNSTTKIDVVESNVGEIQPSTNNGWISFFNSINILGPIAETYGKTLAYKIEVKRLEAEQERVKAQATVIHSAIDGTFQLKMEELKNRRMELQALYITLNKELEQVHIQRQMVLQMAQEAQKAALSPNISIEDRRNYKEMAVELIQSLPALSEPANIQLKSVIESLPKVDITNRLLEG